MAAEQMRRSVWMNEKRKSLAAYVSRPTFDLFLA